MKINRQILNLAIPNIISNITIPLIGMIDIAVAGHLGSEVYIGAIALGAMIFNFIYWNFGFLRMGTSGFTAQAYGARDYRETMRVFVRGLSVALSIAILLLLLQIPISQIALTVINGSFEVENLAENYFFIRIWAAPATLSLYVFKGWFIGMQNTKLPMTIAIAINIFNVVFSLLFAFTFKMGLNGVALGTVVAQYGGLALAILFWFIFYGKFRRYIDIKGSLKISGMIQFFKVNRDIFLRTICLVAVFTFFTSVSANMGDLILAVNTLIMQLFTLFSYIMDGFGYAGEALVGRFVGSKNQKMLNSSIKYINLWGLGISLLFIILYGLWGDRVIGLLTDSESIFEILPRYLFWILLVPLTGYLAFLYDGILVGATASKIMRNCMFVATAVFFILYYTFKDNFGNDGLWLAFIVYLLLRGILQLIFSKKFLSKAASVRINLVEK